MCVHINMHKLYKIISSKSPKFYIGVTGQTLEKRLKQHFYDKKRKRKLNWLKKYKDSISIELIKEFSTEDEAYIAEFEYIQQFWPNLNMINSDKGGRGGRKGVKTSKKTKEKQRKRKLGKKLPLETCKKIAANRPGSKAVIAINVKTKEIKKFAAQKKAAKALGCNEKAIRNVLKGRATYAKGWTFVHKMEDVEKAMSRAQSPKRNKRRIVYIRSDGSSEFFESQYEAAKVLGIPQPVISAIINGKRNSKEGNFLYANN